MFARLRDEGTWETISHQLIMQDHERVCRAASPCAAVIDSQSVKAIESGGVRGYNGGKLIKDAIAKRWRTPTAGRSSSMPAHPTFRIATVPGRCCVDHAGVGRSCNSRSPMPDTRGRVSHAAGSIRVEIVRKPPRQVGFTVLARQWGATLLLLDQQQPPSGQRRRGKHRLR
ncbi:hypothetical protein Acry_0772 [Acidiphilium cryptum JF-5]|uniref:Uncharacterized protein n=1 Tax=Acidiphilium cryptum (strain JF-5) TaxID=349163 RepID=A5FWL0_ACICJ|nr:hypothetical protein Acry_0772 [Acidiphilium cryptum JF-5]